MTRRRGLTLVEVVVGLAILSTLLATALVARSRLARQAADADRRRRAAAAADALLAQWWRNPDSLPRAGNGVLVSERFGWRTSVLLDADATDLGAEVVRLELTADPGAAPGGSSPEGEPLARVDVLLPLATTAEGSHGTR